MKSHLFGKLILKKMSNQWSTSKMEVSEGFQVYCREGATRGEFKKLIDRRR